MLNLNVFNSAMGKAEFKEKLGRFLQYGARMLSGILTDADIASPNQGRKDLISKVCIIALSRYPEIYVDKFFPVSPRRFPANV